MTNRKTTRRALVLSLLSLLVCCSMLVGTTFAWFTDNVTSGNNRIVAGNLDIELEYWNGTAWVDVHGKTDILTNELWEPGVTEVAYLRVANAGTLALKYQLGINIVSEKSGVNVDGDTFKLSDYIQFGVIENVNGETDAYASREAAVAAVANAQKISAGYSKASSMTAGQELYLALVVYMPTTVDNEANYKTSDDALNPYKNRPEINLGLNVFATQVEHEMDSFDINYDKSVAVFTVAEANALLAENKDAYLINCNEPNGILYVPVGYTGTLILDNVKIASVQEGAAPVTTSLADGEPIVAPEDDGTKIGIVGNVTVQATEEGMSAITGTELNIFGNGHLTATGKGVEAFGIGGMDTESITITGVTIDYVEGGCAYGVGPDTKYYKDAPEGGAAIGSGKDGAVITLNKVNVTKAIGGSKAAAIGARYWTGVTVNITDSTIAYAEGGVSAAGIGGSRVSNGASESGTTINVSNSDVTAKGGAYGAGIGSGYDTHCQAEQPLTTINITDSTINAQGGKYAAGVGTGYHNAALAGEIKNSTVKAASGEKVYKTSYTSAMDVGFGVTDPTREGQQTDSKLIYNGVTITMGDAAKSAANNDELKELIANGATEVLLMDGEYDLKGIQKDGLTLIGAGSNVKVANTTQYAGGKSIGAIWQAINLKNVTITNTIYTMADGGTSTFTDVTFAAGVRQAYGKGVSFDGCTFGSNSEGYALHFQTDSASEGGMILLNDCQFEGGKVHLGGKRAYTFSGCAFAEGTDFQVWSNITLDNCTVNGEKITAENAATFFPNLNLDKVSFN